MNTATANMIVQQQFGVLTATQGLRYQLLDALTDADLDFKLPGDNPTLRELCVASGVVDRSYIEGFKTFRQDFTSHQPDAEAGDSIEALRRWFQSLDEALKAAVAALTDADLAKPIDRGYGFTPPAHINFGIYRESLLIFCAKTDVYLRALGKTMPEQWQQWMG